MKDPTVEVFILILLSLFSEQAGRQARRVRKRHRWHECRQNRRDKGKQQRQVLCQDHHRQLWPTLNLASSQHLASVLCIPLPSFNFLIPVLMETLVTQNMAVRCIINRTFCLTKKKELKVEQEPFGSFLFY